MVKRLLLLNHSPSFAAHKLPAMKKPAKPAAYPKLVTLTRYAQLCGVSYQAILKRTKALKNPLPVVEKTDEDTKETKRYINTEENPPVKLDQRRQPVASPAGK